WKPYEFKWKPGDPTRAPQFCEPHMPRLDWQMWFAALEPRPSRQWFINFVIRLLQGEPKVLGLMKENPFPDKPPKYIRVVRYRYTFTDAGMRKRSGEWWNRELVDLYLPPASFNTASPVDSEF